MSYKPLTPEERALRLQSLSDFSEQVKKVMAFASRLKQVMLSKGKKVVRCKCPDHPETFVHARLAGPRNHLHFACEVSDCRYRMME